MTRSKKKVATQQPLQNGTNVYSMLKVELPDETPPAPQQPKAKQPIPQPQPQQPTFQAQPQQPTFQAQPQPQPQPQPQQPTFQPQPQQPTFQAQPQPQQPTFQPQPQLQQHTFQPQQQPYQFSCQPTMEGFKRRQTTLGQEIATCRDEHRFAELNRELALVRIEIIKRAENLFSLSH